MRLWLPVLIALLFVPAGSAQEPSVEGVHLHWRDDHQQYYPLFHSDMPLQDFDITYTMDGEEHATNVRSTSPGYGRSSAYGFMVPPNATSYRIEDRSFDIQAPPPSADDSVRVAFLADVGMTDNTRAVLDAARAANISALLVGGDLSYADGDVAVWDTWLNFIEPYTSDIPIITARGNHEARCVSRTIPGFGDCYTDESAYLKHFSLPYEELYYATQWGPLRIIVVDTEAYYHRDDAIYNVRNIDPDEQLAFLADALQAPQDMWTVVMMHRPLYSSNGGHGSELGARAHMEPALIAGGADLVMAGHEHAYERTWPVAAGQAAITSGDTFAGEAPIYVVSGGGGQSLYTSWQPTPGWSAAREAAFHFTLIEADATTLTVTALTPDGREIDRFSIIRTQEAGQEPGDGKASPGGLVAAPLAIAIAAMAVRARRR